MSDCRLGNQGIKAIFSALKKNTALRTLTFRRLNAEVMTALSEMLMENKALKILDFSLYTSEFSTEQMQLLLQALRKNKSLQELHIQDDDGKLKAEINEIREILAKNLLPQPPHEVAVEEVKQGDPQQPKPEVAVAEPEEKKVAAVKSTA